MSKSNRKRRNKVYTGDDAKVTQPVIRRYTAVDRGKFGEWWFKRGKLVKRVALFGGGGAAFIYLIIEAFRSIF